MPLLKRILFSLFPLQLVLEAGVTIEFHQSTPQDSASQPPTRSGKLRRQLVQRQVLAPEGGAPLVFGGDFNRDNIHEIVIQCSCKLVLAFAEVQRRSLEGRVPAFGDFPVTVTKVIPVTVQQIKLLLL
jgi:hypothetical protein